VRELRPYCSTCIVVDDGSSDDTAAVAASAGAVVLRHVVNRGQGAAVLTGIRYALGGDADVIVTFDADGQHERTEGMPRSRRLVLRGGILFTRLFSGIRVSDVHNGLRAWSRQAAGELTITLDGMAHASEILDQIRSRGWRLAEVPTTVRYSAYSLGKGQGALNAIRIVLQLILQRLGT
jgi:glycosyltransferase involved in cell wall biosynthesis